MNHAEPAGKQLQVFVSIKESASSFKAKDRVIYLAGGPGSSSAKLLSWVGSNIITDRDLIGIDLRGAGYSRPQLDCPDTAWATMQRCSARWVKEGLRPEFFNSVQAAQDVEAVRRALGDAQVNLYGASYGTVIAQEVMRRYPSRLRSVILTGVIPPDRNALEELPSALEDITRKLLRKCAAQAACHQAYPDLPARFESQFPDLPLDLRRELIHFVQWVGVNKEALGAVPKVIHEALAEQKSPDWQAYQVFTPDTTWSVGEVVWCQERFAMTTLLRLEAARLKAPLFGGLDDLTPDFKGCAALGLSKANPDFLRPLRVNIPTLLMTGEFDTRTPARWLDWIQPWPSRWQKVVVGGEGHAPEWSPCGHNLLLAFLNRPTVNLDTGCAGPSEMNFQLPN